VEQITSAQQIYLAMIEASGQWNNFDGGQIARDPGQNLRTWRSAILTRLPMISEQNTELKHRANLIALRDLPKNQINLDTLFILPEPYEQQQLQFLSAKWSPDEMVWYSLSEGLRALGASKMHYRDYPDNEDRFLLRLWWD